MRALPSLWWGAIMARDVPMLPLPVSHVLMACGRRYRGALGRVRLSIHVTTAADTMQTPTTHSPVRLLPVASDSAPVT